MAYALELRGIYNNWYGAFKNQPLHMPINDISFLPTNQNKEGGETYYINTVNHFLKLY